MAEDIVYRMRLEGGRGVAKQFADVNGEVSKFNSSPIKLVGEAIRYTTQQVKELANGLKEVRTKTFWMRKDKRGRTRFVSARDVFGERGFITTTGTGVSDNVPKIAGQSPKTWGDVVQIVREKNRQREASRKELARTLLSKAFPSQLLLPYNPNAELLPRNQIEKDGLANRIGLQRLARERLRQKLGMDWESRGVANANPANPNSPNYNAPPPPSRWDRWSDNAYERIKTLVPKGAARDIIGRIQGTGAFGKAIGLFVAGTLAAGAALTILRKIVSSLFGPLMAMADEVFKFYRTRHQMGGLNKGELSKMGWAGYIMGGKPEENYALMARIAGERASLLWGGDGGKYMSVARRFGVDISGSGAGGLATEREWMRAIAIRMQELDSSGKLALANEAGLSREQMWLVSNGLRYYDWASSRETLAQMAFKDSPVLGNDIYTDNLQQESQNFWTDWGAFVAVFKEFIGSIGEILIPVVNLILEILIGVFGLLNLFLKPIATLIGKIFSLLNISFWANMSNMEEAIPNYGKYDMGMMQTATHDHPNASINIGDINVTSNRADPEEVAKEVGNAVVQVALSRIYVSSAGGIEGSVT